MNIFTFMGIHPNREYGVDAAEIEPCRATMMPVPADLPAGDIGAEVAALAVITGNQQKEAARHLKRSSEAMQRVAEDRELNVMRRKAELQMAQGIVSTVGATVSGVMTIASGGCGNAAARGDFVGQAASAANKLIESEITHKDADAKHYANEAARCKAAANDAQEATDDAKKLANKGLEFYQSWVQGQASLAQAALHRS